MTAAARPPTMDAVTGPRGLSVAVPIGLLLQQCRRIAIVGLQADDGAPPNVEAGKLLSFGLDVYPIHPTASLLLGVRCHASLRAIPDAIDLVQVLPNPQVNLEEVARDAAMNTVRVFWYDGPELPAAIVERLGIAHVHVVIGHELAIEHLALEE